MQQKEIVDLAQHGFIQSADHVGDKKTRHAEVPRARHDIADRIAVDVQMGFLEKDKRKAPGDALDFAFAEFA